MHAVDHLKTHDKFIEAVEHLARLPVRVLFVVLPKCDVARHRNIANPRGGQVLGWGW